MKYLVMECHKGYAVVMDNEGRFLKAANLNYEVGQRVSSIIEMKVPDTAMVNGSALKSFSSRKWITSLATLAACLCLMLLGSWQYFMVPFGTVQVQINPDILISVNRLDYVIQLEGLNDDGTKLIANYAFHRKRLDTVVDELADKAMRENYLKEGGQICLTVFSKNKKWTENTEKHLIDSLNTHFEDTVSITTEVSKKEAAPESTSTIPTASPTPSKTNEPAPGRTPPPEEDEEDFEESEAPEEEEEEEDEEEDTSEENEEDD